MSKDYKRADFMTAEQKTKLGDLPRTHANCKIYTGVMRPGKTACDHARRGISRSAE